MQTLEIARLQLQRRGSSYEFPHIGCLKGVTKDLGAGKSTLRCASGSPYCEPVSMLCQIVTHFACLPDVRDQQQHWLAVLIRMQPDPVQGLAFVVEDVLSAIVESICN